MSELAIIILVAGSYAATNIDNLAILVGWMLAGRASAANIASGYAAGSLAVLVVAVILGLSSYAIPVHLIGYLGFVPIGLGVHSLIRQVRGRETVVEDLRAHGTAALGIAATLTANSADTIIVFSPLLVDSHVRIDAYIASAFVVMAAVWYQVAKLVCRHARKLKSVVRVAGWVAPFIMIYVGIYILLDTSTDVI